MDKTTTGQAKTVGILPIVDRFHLTNLGRYPGGIP